MGFEKTRGTAVKGTLLFLLISEFFVGIALAGAGTGTGFLLTVGELDGFIEESMINETIATLERGDRPLSGVELLFGENAEEAKKPWCVDPFTIMVPPWVALTDYIDRLIHEVASGKPIASIERRPRINMNRVRWYRGACESDDPWSALERRFEAEFNITVEERDAAYEILMADIISEDKKLEEKVIENSTFDHVKKIDDGEKEYDELAKKDYMNVKKDRRNKVDDLIGSHLHKISDRE